MILRRAFRSRHPDRKLKKRGFINLQHELLSITSIFQRTSEHRERHNSCLRASLSTGAADSSSSRSMCTFILSRNMPALHDRRMNSHFAFAALLITLFIRTSCLLFHNDYKDLECTSKRSNLNIVNHLLNVCNWGKVSLDGSVHLHKLKEQHWRLQQRKRCRSLAWAKICLCWQMDASPSNPQSSASQVPWSGSMRTTSALARTRSKSSAWPMNLNKRRMVMLCGTMHKAARSGNDMSFAIWAYNLFSRSWKHLNPKLVDVPPACLSAPCKVDDVFQNSNNERPSDIVEATDCILCTLRSQLPSCPSTARTATWTQQEPPAAHIQTWWAKSNIASLIFNKESLQVKESQRNVKKTNSIQQRREIHNSMTVWMHFSSTLMLQVLANWMSTTGHHDSPPTSYVYQNAKGDGCCCLPRLQHQAHTGHKKETNNEHRIQTGALLCGTHFVLSCLTNLMLRTNGTCRKHAHRHFPVSNRACMDPACVLSGCQFRTATCDMSESLDSDCTFRSLSFKACENVLRCSSAWCCLR